MMRTIAVTSGKGGTGKTTVATSVALALAEAGQRVVLFDADLQLANIDIALNLKPEFNLQHVVTEEKTLRDILTPGPAGIRVVCGGSAIPMLMSAGPKRMGSFISQLSTLSRDSDYLIFDTAAGLEAKVLNFLKMSEEVIVVTTPDPTSVTDAYAAIKMTKKRAPDAVVKVVVNQVAMEKEGRQVFDVLSHITKQFLNEDIQFLGAVRHDYQANLATRKRMSAMQMAPTSWFAQDIRKVADNLNVDFERSMLSA